MGDEELRVGAAEHHDPQVVVDTKRGLEVDEADHHGGVEQIHRSVVKGDGGHTARVSDVQGRQVEVHGESIADPQVTKL